MLNPASQPQPKPSDSYVQSFARGLEVGLLLPGDSPMLFNGSNVLIALGVTSF